MDWNGHSRVAHTVGSPGILGSELAPLSLVFLISEMDKIPILGPALGKYQLLLHSGDMGCGGTALRSDQHSNSDAPATGLGRTLEPSGLFLSPADRPSMPPRGPGRA